MTQEIRDIDGIPHVFIDRGWGLPRKFSLAAEPIKFSEKDDRKFMEMYGEVYELVSRNGKSPTVYVWDAIHVYYGSGTQFYDFRAQVNFIREVKPPTIIHEFLDDAIYDPSDGSLKRHDVVPKKELGISDYEECLRYMRTYEHDMVLERKLCLDLADMLGHKIVGCDRNASLHGEEHFDEREIEHASVIEVFNGSPERPNMAIIGGWHSRRPGSMLLKKLEEKGIDYTVVVNLGYERVCPVERGRQPDNMTRYISTLKE